MKLLEELVSIRSAASDESKMAEFIKDYVTSNSSNWKVQPQIVSGDGFQDCVILVFGEPRTTIYAHMDSIGFSTGYDKELIKVGTIFEVSCELTTNLRLDFAESIQKELKGNETVKIESKGIH